MTTMTTVRKTITQRMVMTSMLVRKMSMTIMAMVTKATTTLRLKKPLPTLQDALLTQ